MSFTVAPLTAAVMGSVSDHFSGTASGVNNALTRISNVFANAIFGALAVLFFAGALQDHIKTIPLDAKTKQAVVAEAVNLGNAKVPENVNSKNKTAIDKAYHDSFIHAYANIMRISAGLGFLGALMSFAFIRNSAVKKS
jgi:preprotein translocase subunit SecG